MAAAHDLADKHGLQRLDGARLDPVRLCAVPLAALPHAVAAPRYHIVRRYRHRVLRPTRHRQLSTYVTHHSSRELEQINIPCSLSDYCHARCARTADLDIAMEKLAQSRVHEQCTLPADKWGGTSPACNGAHVPAAQNVHFPGHIAGLPCCHAQLAVLVAAPGVGLVVPAHPRCMRLPDAQRCPPPHHLHSSASSMTWALVFSCSLKNFHPRTSKAAEFRGWHR